jgi:fibronectin-binding autotransporter adhesin
VENSEWGRVMAAKYLSANAALSAAVWWTTSGGSTTTTAPTTGDNANLNGHTLTIDQTFTCDNIVGAGTLAVSGSRTINANVGDGTSGLTCTLNAAQTVTINGNILAASSATILTVSGASTIVNIAGNVTGCASGGSMAAISLTNGILSIVGTLTSGSGNSNTHGLYVTGGTCSINGVLLLQSYAGTDRGAALCVAGGNATVSHDVDVTANGPNTIRVTSGTLTVNANVYNTAIDTLAPNQSGPISQSGGKIVVNGTITAGSSGKCKCGINTSGGVIVINGTVVGGTFNADNLGNDPYAIYGQYANITVNGNIIAGTVFPFGYWNSTFTFNPSSGNYVVISGQTLTVGSGGTNVIVIEEG